MNMDPTMLPAGQGGYHKLATLMTRDQGIAIFRRFDCINMLSLLSLQAEIQELQEDFWDQCSRDRTSGLPEKEMYTFWFQKLRESEKGESAQYQKLKILREKTREYSMCRKTVTRSYVRQSANLVI